MFCAIHVSISAGALEQGEWGQRCQMRDGDVVSYQTSRKLSWGKSLNLGVKIS